MTKKTEKTKRKYQLLGARVVETPIIGPLRYDDVGKPLLESLNRQFGHVEGLRDSRNYNSGDILEGNFLRTIFYAGELRKAQEGEKDLGLRVATDEDLALYGPLLEQDSKGWDALAFSSSVVAYPNAGVEDESFRRDLLRMRESKLPMIIRNPELQDVRRSLGYGNRVIILKSGPATTFTEASWMAAPLRVAESRVFFVNYDLVLRKYTAIPEAKRKFADAVVEVNQELEGFCPITQFYDCDENRLFARETPHSKGIVPIIQTPVDDSLDKILKDIQSERKKQIEEIKSRCDKAINYIHSGERIF